MKKRLKYLVVLLLLLLAVFLTMVVLTVCKYKNDIVNQPVTSSSAIEPIRWLTYTSQANGFIFSYPEKSIYHSYWTYDSPEVSNLDTYIPTTVSENDNIVYVRAGKIGFEQADYEYKSDVNGDGSLNYGVAWRMDVRDVASDAELNRFILHQFGSACTYNIVQGAYKGTFDVSLIGDGKGIINSDCVINAAHHIKYSPASHKVAFWHTGQECQIGLNFDNCFDKRISQSFRFSE